MSSHQKESLDPMVQEKLARLEKRDSKVDHIFRRILHTFERIIAAFTLIALLGAVILEIYHCVTDFTYFSDFENLLHNILSIVVGLEFVRMLIDTTPNNILEVLTVAITRHVILSHENPWANVASIGCIAALFAIRRYLIRRSELKEEMVEIE